MITANDEIATKMVLEGSHLFNKGDFDDLIYLQTKSIGFIGDSKGNKIHRFAGDCSEVTLFCNVDMEEGERFRFEVNISETVLAAQVSNNEILIFYDTNEALSRFVKVVDPSAFHGSKITYFTFLGNRHFLIANSKGRINIFLLTKDTVEQIATYTLSGYSADRENLMYATKTLKEDRIAFLTSNYTEAYKTFSSVYIYQISRDNDALKLEKKVNMELFQTEGWDANLASVNIDFYNGDVPYVMCFPSASPHIYSLDLSTQGTKTKAIIITQNNTRSLAFYNTKLFGIDDHMQMIEISHI